MGGVGSAIGGVITGVSAKMEADRAYRSASQEQARREAELNSLEASRQPIVNPYANYSDLSDMAANLGDMVSNPFANMGVATQAAKMQAEEADISLANTLDLLAATGASAGGATALAQAALQSKRGVSQSLEKQEAQNDKLAAQGEQFLQQQQMAEAQRVQQAQMTEAQRMQQADVLGREFVYGEKERRETEQLNRLQAQITGQQQVATTHRQNAANIMASGLVSSAEILSSGFTSAGRLVMAGTPVGSDIRLKKNIKLIGRSNSGLKIYSFEYIDKKHGSHTYQGVMSNEVPKEAVIKGNDGYDLVDYSKLDVEFKRI